MRDRIEPWPRPHFKPSGALASVEFFCLAEHELQGEGGPGNYRDWCPREERPEWLSAGTGFLRRATSPAWFDWVTSGPVRPDGPLCHPHERMDIAKRLPEATHLYKVGFDLPDPIDLGDLQTAWAGVRWYLDAGAWAVLDARALVWRMRDEVLEWQGAQRFSLRREVRIMIEKLASPENSHVIATRGMVKFARPDLVYVMGDVTAAQLEMGKYFVEGVATELALGRLIATGEEGFYEGIRFRLETYKPNENAPDMQLDADAALLVRMT